jgi:hypothetical protein
MKALQSDHVSLRVKLGFISGMVSSTAAWSLEVSRLNRSKSITYPLPVGLCAGLHHPIGSSVENGPSPLPALRAVV